jgi:hypothetical protein
MMSDNYNIIELFGTVVKLQEEVFMLKNYVEKLEEMIINPLKKVDFDVKADCEGFWTITEILLHYGYSEQYFYKLKKLIPLKKAGKKGKKIRYNKKNVLVWGKKIELLKISSPDLFSFEIKKAC